MQAEPVEGLHILNLPDSVLAAVVGHFRDLTKYSGRDCVLFWVCKDTRRHLLINTKKLRTGITNDNVAGVVHTAAGSGVLETLTVSGRSQSGAVHKLLQLGVASAAGGRAYTVTYLHLEDCAAFPLENTCLVPSAFPHLSQLTLDLHGALAHTAAALLTACAQAGVPLHTVRLIDEPNEPYPPVLPAVAALPNLRQLKLKHVDQEVGSSLAALAPLAGQLTSLRITADTHYISKWPENTLEESVIPAITALTNLRHLKLKTGDGFEGVDGDGHLAAVATALPNLTDLDFSHHNCGQQGFAAIMQLSGLQYLELRHFEASQSYADQPSELGHVVLNTRDSLCMQDLAAIPKTASLSINPSNIYLRPGTEEEAEAAVRAYEDARSLGVYYEEPNDEAMLKIRTEAGATHMLRAMGKLQHGGNSPPTRVTISMSDLDDSAARALAQHWPGLKNLKLQECQQVTLAFFQHLAFALSKMPHLEALELEHCTPPQGLPGLDEGLKGIVMLCLWLGPRSFTLRGHGLMGCIVQAVANWLKQDSVERPPLLGGACDITFVWPDALNINPEQGSGELRVQVQGWKRIEDIAGDSSDAGSKGVKKEGQQLEQSGEGHV